MLVEKIIINDGLSIVEGDAEGLKINLQEGYRTPGSPDQEIWLSGADICSIIRVAALLRLELPEGAVISYEMSQ